MEQHDRDDETARTWRKRLERWQKSGLAGQAFAQKEGVASSTLYLWSRRLGMKGTARMDRPSTTALPRLLPVIVTPTERTVPPSAVMLEVLLPSGAVVRVPPGFDEGTLARVVLALGGSR